MTRPLLAALLVLAGVGCNAWEQTAALNRCIAECGALCREDRALAPLTNEDGFDTKPTAARAYLLREPLTDAAEHCTAQCTPGTVARFAWSAGRTGECTCAVEEAI